MTKEEILEKVDKVLEEEGMDTSGLNLSNEEKLQKYILPSLEQARNTISNLYKYEPKKGSSILGKAKTTILNKLKNIVINVIERESMRQQKFNELTYQALIILVDENKELKKKLKS